MKTFPFVACAALSLLGCTSAQYADEYRVGIDPAFDAEWQSLLTRVVQDWQTRIGEHQIHLSITYASCNRHNGERLICFHPASDSLFQYQNDQYGGSSPGLIGLTVGMQDDTASSDIYFKLSGLKDPVVQRQCALHEMGHGLGLVHTDTLSPVPSGKHIMDPNRGSASLEITCEDVEQFLSYRTYRKVAGDMCQNPQQVEDTVPVVMGNWD